MIKRDAIAIVMAKGYSKRFDGCKNTVDVCGKPLLAYPIETAKAARCFDTVIVSTDSQQVADTAQACGADDVIMRESGWDDYPTCELSVEKSLEKYQKNTETVFSYCGILGGNSIFIRPSWFRAAKRFIEFYNYRDYPIDMVIPDKEFVTLCFCKVDPIRVCGGGRAFVLQHKGIVYDIDTPSDLEVVRNIQKCIDDDLISYSLVEAVHDDLSSETHGFLFRELTQKYKEPFNPKRHYHANAANKWGNYGPKHDEYLE